MDCSAGDPDHADNPAHLAATMESTQAHQPSPQPSMDQLGWALMQDSPQPVVTESGAEKREFDSSFPISPGRSAKRLCSHSPMHLDSGNNNGDALDNSTIKIEDAIKDGTTIAHMPSETLQISLASSLSPLPLQGALVVEIDAPETNATSHCDKMKQLENFRNEIHRHINIIQQNNPNCQIDRDISAVLIGELAKLTADKILASSEEIAQMRRIVANMATSRAQVKADQAGPQHPPSPSISELTPVPSVIYTPSSLYGYKAVAPSPKLKNRYTQTEEATIHTENDASMPSDARYNDVSDIELWKRELESIRRLEPLVDGICTTVNVPLRTSTSQPASTNQRIAVSTQQGLRNNFHFISGLKPIPLPALRRAVASGDRGNKNFDVISVHDTSDDEGEEGMHARTSRVVGGGDLIYDMKEVQYTTSDENEETNFHDSRFQHQLQLDGSNDTIDNAYNYGDYHIDEGIQGAEVIQYANQPTASTARHDYDVLGEDRSYHDEKSSSSLFLGEDSGESGSGNWDPPRTTAYGCTASTNAGAAVPRERSRSLGYRLDRSVEKTPYRAEQYYHRRYKRDQSPAQIHREKQYNTGRVNVKANSAFARDVNQYSQRYMRDEPESSRFYGYSGTRLSKGAEGTLRYQDRFNNVGEIPGPKTSLRLDLDRYIKDTRINDDALGLERDIAIVHNNTFYAGETLDEEQALRSSWASKSTTLYKGFPLVEDIGFVTIKNHAKPEGDCYWRALGYILYGQPTRWDLIKADHQAYLRHVLSDKTHPRHELYAKLNTQFFETHGATLRYDGFGVTSTFKANIWQLLHMPHSWTPGVMQQVTADLYNIHLVTFEYHERDNMCSSVSIRGAYNSRHVFMLFIDGCHFQPLAVNEYLG